MATVDTEIPETEPSEYQPLDVANLASSAPGRWLKAGWQDFMRRPLFGMGYGLFFFVLVWGTVLGLYATGLEWMLGPALSGAVLVGPLIATGLYRESRRQMEIARGETVGDHHALNMSQVALVGAVLMSLMLIWIRAAVIIYALFFGLKPFPGISEFFTSELFSFDGLLMLSIGAAVGGLFAALVFAISAFSLPLLVDRDVDAFTAMGSSFVGVTRNFWVMVQWGILLTILSGIGVLTGMIGMIIIFPVLGYASWHAYIETFKRG